MSSAASPGVGIHATAVIYGESGVVMVGESGSGKSALALALLARAKATGRFGALIGDDRVWVSAADGRLLASGAAHMAGLIERRAAGVQSAPSEPVAVIKLVVDLSGRNRRWPRWPGQPEESIAGVDVPRLALDSAASAVDNAVCVDERLALIAVQKGGEIGISLEQSAAVHKNKNLRLRGRVRK